MTLSDVLSRGVQLELHEAVAVVRDVIDRLLAAGHRGVPQLYEIDLLPQGAVELRGWALGGDDAIARLTQLLTELLDPALPPPASLAAALEGPHPSIEAFSEALAYFERPNRSLTLQEVHRRASGSEFMPEAEVLAAALRNAPPAATVSSGGHDSGAAAQRQKLMMAAGVFAAIALGGVLMVMIARFTDGAAASGGGLGSVTAAVGGAVSSISERVGLSSPKPQPEPPPPAPAQPEPAKPQPVPRRDRPADSVAQGIASPAEPPATDRGAPVTIPADLRTIILPSSQDREVEPPDPLDSNAIYTDGAPGVRPAVAVRPQLPSELPPGLRDEEIGRVELIIGTGGLVETVKILGTPPTIHESMLLSAAKAWRFEPATRNGVPVKFRTVISVARGPR
jgi:hypothetical protein